MIGHYVRGGWGTSLQTCDSERCWDTHDQALCSGCSRVDKCQGVLLQARARCKWSDSAEIVYHIEGLCPVDGMLLQSASVMATGHNRKMPGDLVLDSEQYAEALTWGVSALLISEMCCRAPLWWCLQSTPGRQGTWCRPRTGRTGSGRRAASTSTCCTSRTPSTTSSGRSCSASWSMSGRCAHCYSHQSLDVPEFGNGCTAGSIAELRQAMRVSGNACCSGVRSSWPCLAGVLAVLVTRLSISQHCLECTCGCMAGSVAQLMGPVRMSDSAYRSGLWCNRP